MIVAYLAGAWLLGVVAAAGAGEPWWPGVAAIGTAGLIAAALERRPALALLGLACAGLFVAGALRSVDQRPPDQAAGIAVYNAPADAALGGGSEEDPTVRFRALVAEEPEVRGRSQRVRLEVRAVFRAGRWQPVEGGVLMRRGLFPRHRYGDLLELEGKLETPPASPDFDYREHLARRDIGSVIDYPEVRTIASGQGSAALEALHAVRRHLGDALGRALPEPQAALAQALVLGQRTAIPRDLTDDLNATGTGHLIAISGHNVSLVAGLVLAALAWLIGRRQAALVALVAIAGFGALTGAAPTVVRAAIMGGLFVAATLAGRPTSAANSILLAAAIMAGWQPLVVWDVSFQLSFAAVAGLVYLAPGLQTWGADLLRRGGIETGEGGLAAFLLESGAVTLGALLATLPITALNFERVSLVAPLSNLLLVPAFPLILGASALSAVAGVAWAPLGEATGWLAWALLTYLIEVARFCADLPLASLQLEGFGAGHAAAAYLALAGVAWWLTRRRPAAAPAPVERPAVGALRIRPVWTLAGGLALTAGLSWWAALGGAGGGRLVVSVLDVGQGDAILVETPDRQRLLVDGGPSGQALLRALGEELPFWERTLDLVVLTQPDQDHLAGLIDLLERYHVRQVLATPAEADTAVYWEWRRLLREQAIPYREARPGERVALGEGAELGVLAPGREALASGEPNDASLVLKLTWGAADFLLAGDIEAFGEAALLTGAGASALRAEVLKVPHHGSASSSSEAFLRAVDPAVAVISVGRNPFGHPAPAVLRRLEGSVVLRTDRHGTVRIETDGRRLWLRVADE